MTRPGGGEGGARRWKHNRLDQTNAAEDKVEDKVDQILATNTLSS